MPCWTVPPELDGLRLDAALARLVPELSRSQLQRHLEDGRVRLDASEHPAGKQRVRTGQSIALELPPPQPHGSDAPQDIALDLLHEDADVLVVNKPAGLVVHPGAGNPAGTLVNALLHHDPALGVLPRAGIVHRLDKDTSGALLVARNARAYATLTARMAARDIHREYLAVVQGELISGGSVDAPLDRHHRDRTRMAVSSAGRPAVSHYRIAARARRHTVLAITLETGRTHQIRVHMAHIGHPVVGDRTYGRAPMPPPGCAPALREALQHFARQALHARELSFDHPVTGETLTARSPVPADLTALTDLLAADAREHAAGA